MTVGGITDQRLTHHRIEHGGVVWYIDGKVMGSKMKIYCIHGDASHPLLSEALQLELSVIRLTQLLKQ